MNTSMKIYLVIHKFCDEDYDGNTMLGEEIITSFSTKETAERFVLKWSNPHSLPKPYDGIYLGELYIKELTLDSVNIDEDPHIGKDLEDYYCRDYEDEEEEESEDAPSYDEHIDDEVAEVLSLVQTLRAKNCLSLISTAKMMPITLTLTSSTSFTGFPAIATSTVRALLFAR